MDSSEGGRYSHSDKDSTRDRYIRGSAKFEQRKRNEAELRRRGGRRNTGMRSNELDLASEYEGADDLGRSRTASQQRASPKGSVAAVPNGRVSSVARTQVTVLRDDGSEEVALVTPRVTAAGSLVVGDAVEVDAKGRVVARAERRTILERRAPGQRKKRKVLAANVDVGLVVLAPRGSSLSLGFLDRALLALDGGGMEPLIVVTKIDLVTDSVQRDLQKQLAPWARAGLDIHWVGSPTGLGVPGLREAVRGKVAVMFGQSGVGKSTLVNALDPSALQAPGATREIDGRGRHTTTASRLLPMAGGGALVDTPGIRQLQPNVESVQEAARHYPELAPYLGRCRFPDCAHAGESGCALEEAAATSREVRKGLERLRRFVASQEPG